MKQLVEAWNAIISHPAYPDTPAIVSSEDVDDTELSAMLIAFDAMPLFQTDEEVNLTMNTPENRVILKSGWLRDQWTDAKLWHPEDHGSGALRRVGADFFMIQYEGILAESTK